MVFQKGYTMTEEHKIKIALANKGRKPSLGAIEASRKTNTGRKLSEEHKRKINRKGKTHTISVEARRRLSEMRKGKNCGKLNHFYGLKHSEETKDKISLNKRNHENLYIEIRDYKKIRKRIKSSREYKTWVRNIKERDKICIKCKSRKMLQTHHIVPLSLIIRKNRIKSMKEAVDCTELWALNNGEVLCIDCHMKTESWGKITEVND